MRPCPASNQLSQANFVEPLRPVTKRRRSRATNDGRPFGPPLAAVTRSIHGRAAFWSVNCAQPFHMCAAARTGRPSGSLCRTLVEQRDISIRARPLAGPRASQLHHRNVRAQPRSNFATLRPRGTARVLPRSVERKLPNRRGNRRFSKKVDRLEGPPGG